MAYWLMKSEPTEFSIDDLAARDVEAWSGVRNYQARNLLRDQITIGDQAFFYHSSCPQPGIVGIMDIVRAGYPDPTALDPSSPYFDPRSDPHTPRWYCVDVCLHQRFPQTIPLHTLKACPPLQDMPLLRRGNRLSVMPVTPEQWQHIISLMPGERVTQ